MSEAEEKLIKILEEHITLHSVRQGYGVFNITSFEEIARGILEAGYLRVEPVQLDVLTNEEILEALPSWGVIYQDKVITSRDKLVSEATIAKNSKKQLYRRIE